MSKISRSNLKRILVAGCISIFLIVSLNSCGLFKNSRKQKNIEKTESVVKVDSNETTSGEVKVSDKTINKDVNVVINERETTTKKTTKGEDIKVTTDKSKINPNGETELIDSITGQKIILILDSLSNSLTIKLKSPEVVEETTIKERTTSSSDKSKESQKDSADTYSKQVAVTSNERSKSSSSQSSKESKSSLIAIIGLFLGIAIMIVTVAWGIKKFVLKK